MTSQVLGSRKRYRPVVGRYRACNCESRIGFTILELLIVLVIMSMILALAWPQLKRKIARSRLKQIAIDLQADLSDARREAMRNGQIYGVSLSEKGDQYVIASLKSLQQSTRREIGGTEFETVLIASGDADQNSLQDSWMASKVFDDSIRLKIVDPSQPEDQGAVASYETIEIGDQKSSEQSGDQQRLTITPDGRSKDVLLVITDLPNRLSLTLNVRGLTGQVEIGEFTVLSRESLSGDAGQGEDSEFIDESLSEFDLAEDRNE